MSEKVGVKSLPGLDRLISFKHPKVFEQALLKFQLVEVPESNLEKILGNQSYINPDMEERYWAVWGNLNQAHSL